MIFKIPVHWHMYGEYEVEADTLDIAYEKVLNADPPYDSLPNGEYIDGSIHINTEVLNELYPPK